MKINGKTFTAMGLMAVAAWGAAMALSTTLGCTTCVEVLTGYKASLPNGEIEAVSGTAIISGTEVPITGVVVSPTAE